MIASILFRLMCSVLDPNTKRAYTRPCLETKNITKTKWGSLDMDVSGRSSSGFVSKCPYYSSCVLTSNAPDFANIGLANNKECGRNSHFNFIGLIGRVTKIDKSFFIPVLTVTFNDGRTEYEFPQDVLKLEYVRSMYELWWVQRTKSEFIVQSRKGFNITSPVCSFDLVNDR